MQITLDQLNELEACEDGTEWCKQRYGYAAAEHEQYKQDLLADEHLDGIFWAIKHIDGFSEVVSADELDKCAEQWPAAALKYASNLLTKERKKWCEEQIGE